MAKDRTPASLDTFLTAAEAATHLRVSRSMIYKLVYRGQLRVARVGRAIRIRRAALMKFAEKST